MSVPANRKMLSPLHWLQSLVGAVIAVVFLKAWLQQVVRLTIDSPLEVHRLADATRAQTGLVVTLALSVLLSFLTALYALRNSMHHTLLRYMWIISTSLRIAALYYLCYYGYARFSADFWKNNTLFFGNKDMASTLLLLPLMIISINALFIGCMLIADSLWQSSFLRLTPVRQVSHPNAGFASVIRTTVLRIVLYTIAYFAFVIAVPKDLAIQSSTVLSTAVIAVLGLSSCFFVLKKRLWRIERDM